MRQFKILQDDIMYRISADRIYECSDDQLRFSRVIGNQESTCAVFNGWKYVIELFEEDDCEEV